MNIRIQLLSNHQVMFETIVNVTTPAPAPSPLLLPSPSPSPMAIPSPSPTPSPPSPTPSPTSPPSPSPTPSPPSPSPVPSPSPAPTIPMNMSIVTEDVLYHGNVTIVKPKPEEYGWIAGLAGLLCILVLMVYLLCRWRKHTYIRVRPRMKCGSSRSTTSKYASRAMPSLPSSSSSSSMPVSIDP